MASLLQAASVVADEKGGALRIKALRSWLGGGPPSNLPLGGTLRMKGHGNNTVVGLG